MQDEMVAELKAAGSSLPGPETAATVIEGGGTDTAVNESSGGVFKSQILEGFEDLAATPRAAALKQVTPASGAKKKPGPPSSGGHGAPSSAKRGRVGGKAGGGGGGRKGRRKPGRPAGGGSMKTGGAKKPTRTRLSISDFDGVAQVLMLVV